MSLTQYPQGKEQQRSSRVNCVILKVDEPGKINRGVLDTPAKWRNAGAQERYDACSSAGLVIRGIDIYRDCTVELDEFLRLHIVSCVDAVTKKCELGEARNALVQYVGREKTYIILESAVGLKNVPGPNYNMGLCYQIHTKEVENMLREVPIDYGYKDPSVNPHVHGSSASFGGACWKNDETQTTESYAELASRYEMATAALRRLA
jgi:hypothetical protein